MRLGATSRYRIDLEGSFSRYDAHAAAGGVECAVQIFS
jgi:hypothetical protein